MNGDDGEYDRDTGTDDQREDNKDENVGMKMKTLKLPACKDTRQGKGLSGIR